MFISCDISEEYVCNNEPVIELIHELYSLHPLTTRFVIEFLVKNVLMNYNDWAVQVSLRSFNIVSLRSFIMKKLSKIYPNEQFEQSIFDELNMSAELANYSEYGSFSPSIYLDIASYLSYKFQGALSPDVSVIETFFAIILEKNELFKQLVHYIQYLKIKFDATFNQNDCSSGVFSDIYLSKHIVLKVICSTKYRNIDSFVISQLSTEVTDEISVDHLYHKHLYLVNLYYNKLFRFHIGSGKTCWSNTIDTLQAMMLSEY